MNRAAGLIAGAAQALVFDAPPGFSWFGKRPRVLSRAVLRALPRETLRSHMVSSLQDHLYRHFYLKGFACPVRWEPSAGGATATAFNERLARANASSGYWSSGWKIERVGGDSVIVTRGWLRLRVATSDCRCHGDARLEPGMKIAVRFPNHVENASPGFFMATSDCELPPGEWRPLVRVYWNATPNGAVALVRSLTSKLNALERAGAGGLGVPFRLKALKVPAQFSRCDTVVLYLHRRDFERARDVLEVAYAEHASDLRIGIPVFTKPLAPEVGLAEDPVPVEGMFSSGQSFGLHRCLLLAEGMLRAEEEGRATLSDRLVTVRQTFEDAGIDLDNPFLNPGSSDIYGNALSRTETRLPDAIVPNGEIGDSSSSAAWFLDVARALGRRLCADAIWHGDRCTWLGISGRDTTGKTYTTMGPDVYAGTAGVALFLAELNAKAPDPAFERTARGAMRHAEARRSSIAPLDGIGLYTGWIGMALAAVRVGALLGHDELRSFAMDLVLRARSERLCASQLDLLAGSAGAIIGLLLLRDLFPDGFAVDFACQLGDEIVASAVRRDRGCSWKTINRANEHHLTGLSHGTAGIGLALCELFHVTGETRFRETAELAFAYERHWFDADVGNWPDLREASTRRKGSKKHARAFSNYWCHGAPGIALSRLRAHEILGDPQYKLEALTALATTRRALLEALDSASSVNFSLCHGMAGNADVLLEGDRILGDGCCSGRSLASRIARIGAHRHAMAFDWPCGAGIGPTASLLLGLSGIGLSYLRLAAPDVASVLLPQRAKCA